MANEKKSEVLGMPFGTASGRLRKMIIFRMAQRLGEDICFRCRERIASVDELSIEHKIPWLDNVELFWDLDNIAFSHLTCNRPDSEKVGNSQRKIGPPGTSWCYGHEQFLPISEFRAHTSRWNGVDYICRKCKSETEAKRRIQSESSPHL